MPKPQFILEFTDIDRDRSEEVGAKAANLGEMVQAGFPVPPGFVLPAGARAEFMEQNNLRREIDNLEKTVNKQNLSEVQSANEKIARLVSSASFPHDLKEEIVREYHKLGSLFKQAHVAVRPSAIVEDSAKSNARGLLHSQLNVYGEANLLEAIKQCWASGVEISIIIQKMIDADASGVAFTQDPTDSSKHIMLIEGVWGLGEYITSGQVSPDKYLIERHTLQIEDIVICPQEHQLVLSRHGTKSKRVPSHRYKKQKLTTEQIKTLGKLLQKVHAHYYFPQDVEWALAERKFYLLHIRPLASISSEQTAASKTPNAERSSLKAVLLEGVGVSPGIVTGPVTIIKSIKQLEKVKKGMILVFEKATPDLLPFLKRARGIITDQGGVTSHAAIVTRELGIPCVVGARQATKKLRDGEVVTINGKTGAVQKGRLLEKVARVEKVDIKPQDLKTATKIYLNFSEPKKAKEAAKLPIDGVGLLRAEFIISEIGVHPRHIIAQGRQEFFVQKLSQGLETIAGAFDSRPVVYRTCDFKTNEYRNLQGGKAYEQEEENPLLGFRGAARYLADPEVFELELAAVKKVRERCKNLWIMIPYVRTPPELLHVKRIMAASGLVRSPSLKLWMMVELPVNVILIDNFVAVGIDGISFGSNDLTTLLTGTDRDNVEVARDFEELSPALTWALARVIKACKKAGVTTSICGQAASAYDTLVENLVELGITSISVDPDALGRVQKIIYATERKI